MNKIKYDKKPIIVSVVSVVSLTTLPPLKLRGISR